VEASAFTDASTNARMHVQQRCAVCGHVHECTGPYPWTHLQMHLYLHSITYAFTDLFSSAHLCCAACTYSRFLLLSSAGDQRRGEQLAVTAVPRLERQVGQCAALAVETWLVHAVSIKQQLQKPTTERMLLADLYTELWCGVICHFWETDRLISSRAARNRKSDWQLFGKLHPERPSKTLYNTTMMVLDQW